MGRPLYTNNAATYLAFGITNTATTMQVSANTGHLFPSPVGGDYFYVSLISLSGPIIEIVKCTARSGDIFTIERGQEGTSPLYWNMGDNVQLRITAAGMNYIAGSTASTTLEQSFTATQGQTVFTLTNFDYSPGNNNLAVFVNGSKQVSGTNYTETNVNTVTFTTGLNAGDIVEFLSNLSVAAGTIYATDINYNEGSTGAVTRTLESKLQESISVKDFGAVGNGTTNDTAAIQAAIDSLSPNGGTLYMPPGTYLVDSLVFPADPCVINFFGSGINSTILLMNSPTSPVITSTRASANIRSTGNQFRNFSVKANASGSYSNLNHIAIDTVGFDEVVFDHIGFQSNGTGSCGMLFRTAASPQLTYSQVFQNIIVAGQVGPKYVLQTQNNGGGVGSDTNIIAIRDCWIYANSNMEACFDMSCVTLYSIMDCELETTGNYGIICGALGTMQSNWVEGMTIAPVKFQNTGVGQASTGNTFIANYWSGYSGNFNIVAGCGGNSFIGNGGGNYAYIPATNAEVPIIINDKFPTFPTVTQNVGGTGTLTKVIDVSISKQDGTWESLYTFTPPAPGNYGFSVAAPTPFGITKFNASVADSANAVPKVTSLTYPLGNVIFTATNTNQVTLLLQTTMV